MKKLNVFDYHQLAVAKATLRMTDEAGRSAFGGMTKDTARWVIKKFTGKKAKE